jgi:hypothetical protein
MTKAINFRDGILDHSEITMSEITREVAREITGGKGKAVIPLASLLSAGNKKLPKDMAIFNMGSAMRCPSEKLGLCQAVVDGKVICYALKAERLYPGVKPYRDRQEKFWKKVDAAEFASQFLVLNALKQKPFTSLRINESGDFWGQECVEKAEVIASILTSYGISVFVYTARKDLDYSNVKHLVINGSGFKKPGISNVFQFVETAEAAPEGFSVCPGNCRICTRCQTHDRNTAVVKH